MTIATTSLENFVTYLRSFPDDGILFSSIRGKYASVISYGTKIERAYTKYQFVLSCQGITVEFTSETLTNELFLRS